MLKKITLPLILGLMVVLGMSVAVAPAPAAGVNPMAGALAEMGLPADAVQGMDDFLALSPKKYREMTGKKLSLKEALVLKLAQKKIKKQIKKQKKGKGSKDDQFPKGLFIVCAILLPIAACIFMGVMDDWEGNNWWVAFLLYLLCYIPGLIYTLTKVKDYY